MNALKEALISPPILPLMNLPGHITLDTDACIVSVGCVLLQLLEYGTTRAIGYWSRSSTDTERIFDTTQRECRAIEWTILFIPPYMEGMLFAIWTDNDSPRWIINLTQSAGGLACWLLRLSEFPINVVQRAGIKHQSADELSRLRISAVDNTPLKDNLPSLAIEMTHNSDDTQVCVINTTKDNVIPLGVDNKEALLDIPAIKNKFQM